MSRKVSPVCRALLLGVAIYAWLAAPVAQNAFPLERLTVAADRLAAEGCRLSPSHSMPIGGNRIAGGLWAGLPISTNPWIGREPAVAAVIRERVDGTPSPPDGPPRDSCWQSD